MGNLLLVDDELPLLEAIEELLSGAGHSVNAVVSAEEAVTTLQNAPKLPHAIVTDIRLKGMSGLELLQAVRSHPDWQDIPFVCLSASIPLEMEEFIAQHRDVVFLRKPFEVDDLLAVVSRVVPKA